MTTERQAFVGFGYQEQSSFSLPRCASCSPHGDRLAKLATYAALGGAVLGWVIFRLASVSPKNPYGVLYMMLMAVGTAIAVGVGTYFVLASRPPYRRAGHTRGCHAVVLPRLGKSMIVFHNRAYAEECRKLPPRL
jgi:hypothetical protein